MLLKNYLFYILITMSIYCLKIPYKSAGAFFESSLSSFIVSFALSIPFSFSLEKFFSLCWA